MVILITGVSKGLGRALANLYVEQGHRVFGLCRSQPTGLDSRVQWLTGDVTQDDVKYVVNQLLQSEAKIDLLINNAGTGSSGFCFDQVATDELVGQLQLHCVGALRVTQACLGLLRQSPSPKIINVTSRLGSVTRHLRGEFTAQSFSYPYSIAKAAQNMLTVCMQGDEALQGILIAAVNPGLLRTNSGSADADTDAQEGARSFAEAVAEIRENGAYHALGADATL